MAVVAGGGGLLVEAPPEAENYVLFSSKSFFASHFPSQSLVWLKMIATCHRADQAVDCGYIYILCARICTQHSLRERRKKRSTMNIAIYRVWYLGMYVYLWYSSMHHQQYGSSSMELAAMMSRERSSLLFRCCAHPKTP